MMFWLSLTMVWGTALTAEPPDLYFPAKKNWETIEAEVAGWDAGRLKEAVDFAKSRKTSSLIVLQTGRILTEFHQPVEGASPRYRRLTHGTTADGHVMEDVASVQKSIVSCLVGIAQHRQLVDIKQPVDQYLGEGWSKATRWQESAIQLRHLITMTSGLNPRLGFVAAAGKRWRYNTNAYAKSLKCLEAAASQDANALTRAWLTKPIGMNDSKWVTRPNASLQADANQLGFATSARDLARFGLMVLAQGKWQQQQIVQDQAYLTAALSPSQQLNPSYGFLWWLNGQSAVMRGTRRVPGPLLKEAPSDLVAALGALGRKCYIVPSMQLVVVRLGDDPNLPGKPRFDAEFWRLLMRAAPARFRTTSSDEH